MVRVGIENAPKQGVRNSPDKPRRKSNRCNVPTHLKGKEIIVGQGSFSEMQEEESSSKEVPSVIWLLHFLIHLQGLSIVRESLC